MKYGKLKEKKHFYGIFPDPSLRENGWSSAGICCSSIINNYEYYNKVFKILETEYAFEGRLRKDVCLVEFFNGIRFVIDEDEIKIQESYLPKELFEIR